jgi:hypothetical protein
MAASWKTTAVYDSYWTWILDEKAQNGEAGDADGQCRKVRCAVGSLLRTRISTIRNWSTPMTKHRDKNPTVSSFWW